MTCKELNLLDFSLANIRLTALRMVLGPSKPKTLDLISPATQKNLHRTSWILRFNSYPSRSLTNLQPVAQGSLSNCSASGNNVSSLKRTVPVLIVFVIRILTSTVIYCFVQASVSGQRTGVRCGKAKLAADIRVLDGQRFLGVLPLTNSVGREELTVGEPQPNILHSVSSITCASEIMFIWRLHHIAPSPTFHRLK